jgi:hypothetical protein
MREFRGILVVMVGACALLTQVAAQAQNATNAAAKSTSAVGSSGASTGAASGAAPVAASALIEPAVREMQETLSELNLEKWKKGTVRDEAEENIHSLMGDVEAHVEPLLAAADSAPASLSKTIPLVKHMYAFYDVLLRVEEASRVSAPADQSSAIERSLRAVNQARQALDDQLALVAAIEEKQVGELQAQVKTLKSPPPEAKPAVVELVPCKAAPARKKQAAKKPASAAPVAAPTSQKTT